MAGLQRSVETFRRSGSSGLVWEERFAPEEKKKQEEQQQQQAKMQRSRSAGAGYRTGVVPPALDPPSPKISACGFCSIFGTKSKPGARRR